jgi:hypothetical protein
VLCCSRCDQEWESVCTCCAQHQRQKCEARSGEHRNEKMSVGIEDDKREQVRGRRKGIVWGS